ncbi:unnamed protein product [Didymodactylos carnosus]|uniref:thioredoxin-dependent peroxiredoxin n=1 Tax=Didymodactylos carnosus TaxID=1234261 RepID=A0A813UN23_9BILA|nr:unnamed protein product [Didymodactylos carnosus]CAF1415218.1 unnamed protein product [Didymodactylos carnosus]CAF3612465.1 unnamed protein product [Didymodactylos carnosus]CAF4217808.1 unnamed protein product [Didymodactylos carnosus]
MMCVEHKGAYPCESRLSKEHSLQFSKAQTVINGEFKEVKLADFKGKYLVLLFYPLDLINTPRSQGGLGKIKVPLLSDLTHQIAKDYGVYLQDVGHSLRGLFIIDGRGILRQITMNDLPVGRSVDETLRLLQAFQCNYTDKHGEVCPAGWKPGSDTITPDPEGKLKYFNKHGS